MSQEIRRGTTESICLHDTSQDLVSCGLPAAQREPNARLARPELTLEVATMTHDSLLRSGDRHQVGQRGNALTSRRAELTKPPPFRSHVEI